MVKKIINMLNIDNKSTRSRHLTKSLMSGILVSALAGCGGGESTQENPVTENTGNNLTIYSGAPALTDDIRAFQVNLWEPLRASNRCGGCHSESGGQDPLFVRQDNVNLAYSAVGPLVNLDNPASSRLVSKVGSGHNCWLPSNAACATAVTAYIEDWAQGIAAGSGRQIQLVAPASVAPGATKTFPADFVGFQTHVWPHLQTYCSGCHKESAPTPQSPFFASDTVADAYEAAKSKIDLNSPMDSRLVLRLRHEFHNCWDNCTDNADSMQGWIENYANTITADSVSAPIIFSDALRLPDGVVAAGGNRHETDVIALYEFKTGSGIVALDTSRVDPELNLTLSGNVDWVGGWGIQVIDGKAQGTTATSNKLHDLITATGEYSIEAWVIPANVTQEGPARIISYSGGVSSRNFTLGQTLYNYNFLHRSSTTDGNGEAALSTADADEDLQASLQHVVVTFDPVNGRNIYVNGVHTGDTDTVAPGNLADWDDSFALVLGNEASNDRLWQGIIRMAAIHNRALTPTQVQQNFAVGVGEKFFLLFGISHLINLPQSYIMFEVSQYDSYSYLFNRPTFISLDPTVSPSNIRLEKMRIGINGKEAVAGQAYRNLALDIDASNYSPETGQVLSPYGTIIALENNAATDEFFLTFERLDSHVNTVSETDNLTPPSLPGPGTVSDVGLRTFDEINGTMSRLTGVLVDEPGVQNTFNTVRQQLPSVESIETFVSAHHVGVTQLAIAYCNALVENNALRTTFFETTLGTPGFSFSSDVYAAFATGKQNDIATDLYNRMVGLPGATVTDLTSAPDRVDIIAELINPADGDADGIVDGLYDRFRLSCPDPAPVTIPASCDANRTKTIVKGMCAAILGSATMLLQ